MTRWLLAAAALVFATVSLPNAFATDADAEKPVAMFPDLIDANGAEGSVHPPIGEGKWTLVMVWSTSCHICEIDKPLFSAFHEKHQDTRICLLWKVTLTSARYRFLIVSGSLQP